MHAHGYMPGFPARFHFCIAMVQATVYAAAARYCIAPLKNSGARWRPGNQTRFTHPHHPALSVFRRLRCINTVLSRHSKRRRRYMNRNSLNAAAIAEAVSAARRRTDETCSISNLTAHISGGQLGTRQKTRSALLSATSDRKAPHELRRKPQLTAPQAALSSVASKSCRTKLLSGRWRPP